MGDVLGGVGNTFRTSLQRDYGEQEGLTSLWNSTMDQVASLFLFKLFYRLKENDFIYIYRVEI